MAKATDNPEGGMQEDIAFLKARAEELGTALEEANARIAALEGATPPDTATLVDAVQAVHVAVFGVPAGELQKLKD